MKAHFIESIIVMAALAAVYIVWVRPRLKALPAFADLYAKEDTLWDAILAWLRGRRTYLIGIWGEIIALAPDLLQTLAGLDLKTLLLLPDAWAAYVTAAVPVLMLIFRAKAAEK
jgi:hypothetical protein